MKTSNSTPRNLPKKNENIQPHNDLLINVYIILYTVPLQCIFPTQGLSTGLLHCRQILYHLSHQGNPYTVHHTVMEKQMDKVVE